MDSKQPLSIKLLAVVAGFLVLWPFLFELHFAYLLIGNGLSFTKAIASFWMLFDLTYADAIHMALWLGLLVCLLRQSRWALLFAVLVAVLGLVGMLAIWSMGGIVGPDGLNGYTLIGVVVSVTPFFVLQSTIRLWRQGTLT